MSSSARDPIQQLMSEAEDPDAHFPRSFTWVVNTRNNENCFRTHPAEEMKYTLDDMDMVFSERYQNSFTKEAIEDAYHALALLATRRRGPYELKTDSKEAQAKLEKYLKWQPKITRVNLEIAIWLTQLFLAYFDETQLKNVLINALDGDIQIVGFLLNGINDLSQRDKLTDFVYQNASASRKLHVSVQIKWFCYLNLYYNEDSSSDDQHLALNQLAKAMSELPEQERELPMLARIQCDYQERADLLENITGRKEETYKREIKHGNYFSMVRLADIYFKNEDSDHRAEAIRLYKMAEPFFAGYVDSSICKLDVVAKKTFLETKQISLHKTMVRLLAWPDNSAKSTVPDVAVVQSPSAKLGVDGVS